MFLAIAKLVIPSRRGTSDATRTLCSAVALRIARILIEHCHWTGSCEIALYVMYMTLTHPVLQPNLQLTLPTK